MYCLKCGKEIDDNAVVCVHCGSSLNNKKTYITINSDNIGWIALGFFLPLVGLILYLVNKDSNPPRAEAVGKGALAGVCSSLVFSVVYGYIFGTLLGAIFF